MARLVRFIVLVAVWGSVLALLARVMLADMGRRTGVLVWTVALLLAGVDWIFRSSERRRPSIARGFEPVLPAEGPGGARRNECASAAHDPDKPEFP